MNPETPYVCQARWLRELSFWEQQLADGFDLSGCYTKWPQTEWLQPTQICHFTVLKVRNLMSVSLDWSKCVGRAECLSGGPGENPCLWHFLLLVVSCISWLATSSHLQGKKWQVESWLHHVMSLQSSRLSLSHCVGLLRSHWAHTDNSGASL